MQEEGLIGIGFPQAGKYYCSLHYLFLQAYSKESLVGMFGRFSPQIIRWISRPPMLGFTQLKTCGWAHNMTFKIHFQK